MRSWVKLGLTWWPAATATIALAGAVAALVLPAVLGTPPTLAFFAGATALLDDLARTLG